MGAGKRSSAGERVLEGRHVIGLFFLMLLFSGVFFTLGYVMGKNQLEGQVRAASTHGSDAVLPLKQDPPRQGKSPVSTPDNSVPTSDTSTTPPSSEWEFYHAGEKKAPNDHLKAAPSITAAPAALPKTIAASAKTPVQPSPNGRGGSPNIPKGAYLLQVAAVRSEADAVSLAGELRKKKFPAFVQTPQGDKYYRVQVGPYGDQKTMQTAKKGLETSGFKAIIKH
ncbi:MAG TPA: SPOR domain-containing protein [Candidatus Eisenbacteria bacterium]|jgi:cell division septation protein DedD|nr:SPOR domain-containing protein [Candidatus Eisenbacteria bacterium]